MSELPMAPIDVADNESSETGACWVWTWTVEFLSISISFYLSRWIPSSQFPLQGGVPDI